MKTLYSFLQDISVCLVAFFLVLWAVDIFKRALSEESDKDAAKVMMFSLFLGCTSFLMVGYWVG